uniref:Uncharacterized protein n=1 Tax=Tetranychus urticae TaxID=32264 RepID=T1KU04_TETUR
MSTKGNLNVFLAQFVCPKSSRLIRILPQHRKIIDCHEVRNLCESNCFQLFSVSTIQY